VKDFLQQRGFLWFAHGTLGADLSWVLALAFTILFIIGWRMGKKAQGNQHHGLVLWAMGGMLAYFTIYYLARGLGALATEGKEGFGGPDWIYNSIFAPMLTIHILVVSIGLVLAIYMIVLGFRTTVKQMGQRVLQAGILTMSSSAFLKITVFVLGAFALIAAIRCRSFACGVVYISGFLLVLIVLLAEKGIERLIPDGARRHRLIGTFTMVLYVIALVTSSATYLMLYVIWPPKAQ
jgi:uncharacterized membrane protein YozB (DUF420 family)